VDLLGGAALSPPFLDVGAGGDMWVIVAMCKARFWGRSPPRLSRWRTVFASPPAVQGEFWASTLSASPG
jgi:hypothetical protein